MADLSSIEDDKVKDPSESIVKYTVTFVDASDFISFAAVELETVDKVTNVETVDKVSNVETVVEVSNVETVVEVSKVEAVVAVTIKPKAIKSWVSFLPAEIGLSEVIIFDVDVFNDSVIINGT